jgi:hypothetical protein
MSMEELTQSSSLLQGLSDIESSGGTGVVESVLVTLSTNIVNKLDSLIS